MARLTSELIMRLVDEVSGPAQGVQRAMKRVENATQANRRAIGETQSAMAGTATAAAAAAFALAQPVKAAMRFESAMADVRKVVDFPTPKGFSEFRDELFALSREIPLTVQQLSEIAAAGGSSGLAGEQLIRYTEITAKLATAFDISAESAGDFTNSMRNALGLTLDETLSLSDAVNHLTNSMATTAPKLTDFMTRVAGDLGSAGFSGEQAAAFGAAMQAAGHSSDVSATSFRNMAKALTRGESATKRQVAAYEKLGFSATDIAKRMQEDAVGTTLDVIDQIGKLPEEVRAAVSSDLFGDEARALTGLISNVDLLREALGYVDEEAKYGGSAFGEYMARSKTFEADLQRFQNVAAELSITLGEALLPALSDGMAALTPMIQAASEWAKQNGELVATLVKVGGAVVGLRMGLLGLRLAGLTGKGGILRVMSTGLSGLNAAAAGAAAIGVAASEARRLSQALASMEGRKASKLDKIGASLRGIAGVTGLASVASAIGGFALPIALAAAVAALVWKHFDALKQIFLGIKDAVVAEMKPALEGLEPVFQAAAGFVSPLLKALKTVYDIAVKVGKALREVFTGGAELTNEQASNIRDRARNVTEGLLSSEGRDPGAKGYLPKGMSSTSGATDLGTINLPARAVGGPAAAGIPHLVNENTPRSEWFVPSRSGAILTVRQAQSALASALPNASPALGRPGGAGGGAGGRGPMSVTFGDINVYGGANASPSELGREFGRQIEGLLSSQFSDAVI